jgi:hypothetical protein
MKFSYHLIAAWLLGSIGWLSTPLMAQAPANDDLCNATALTLGATCSGTPNGDNTNATLETSEPLGSCFVSPNATVWYSFVAPASGAVEISTDIDVGGTNTDTEIALYELTGGNCADLTGLTALNCDQDGGSTINFNSVIEDTLTGGNTYYVQVSGYDGTEGTFCIEVNEIMAVPPANDDLCNATALTVGAGCSGTPNGDNTDATLEANEPVGSCFVSPDISVWFSFVAPPSGAVEISTDIDVSGTNDDTEIALYDLTGGNCADLTGLTALDCDQDGGTVVGLGFNSIINYAGLTVGNTYYVQVSGYQGLEGTFCIEVNENLLAPNDSACGAIDILVDGSVNLFNNAAATLDPLETTVLAQVPSGGGGDNFSWFTGDTVIQSSLWFTFTAPASGRAFIDLCSHGQTNFDTQIALYAATDCGDYTTYTLVGANDDSPDACGAGSLFSSAMEVSCLTAGDTYYLLVDGYADARGDFGIAISEIPAILPTVSAILAVPTQCGNDGILLSQGAGIGPFDYSWSDGGTGDIRFGIAPGTYTLTVTDACDSTATAAVTVDAGPAVMADAGPDTSLCDSGEVVLGGEMSAMGGTFPETSRVYSTSFPGDGVTLEQSQPYDPTPTTVAPIAGISTFSGDFAFGHEIFFAIDVENDPANLIIIDYQTGSSSSIGAMVPGTDESVTGLAFDDKAGILYAVAYNTTASTASSVYEVDPNTGSLTLAATFPNVPLPIWIAVDTASNMYALDIVEDVVYSLDVATGVATQIGDLPFNASFGQDADFDPSTNELFFTTIDVGAGNQSRYARYDIATGGVFFLPGNSPDQIGALGIRPKDMTYTYSWSAGPGDLAVDSAEVANPLVIADQNGRNSYVLTVTDGCGNQATDTVALDASVAFELDVAATPQYGLPFAQGTAVATPINGIPPYTYDWSTGATGDSIGDLVAGSYTVTVTDSLGCTSEAEFVIDDATSVLEFGISSLSVFPNPNQGVFEVSISLESASEVALSLLDARGRQVYQRTLTAASNHAVSLDLSGMAEGVYLLGVQTEQGRAFRRVMVR